MIVSTHGILASSGAVDIASGYLFKSTTNSTVVTGTTANTISYSNLIPANTMLVGDFFQYQLNFFQSYLLIILIFNLFSIGIVILKSILICYGKVFIFE